MHPEKCVHVTPTTNAALTFISEDVAATVGDSSQLSPPKFQTALLETYSLSEGQSTHLEARLTPTEDPDLKVKIKSHIGIVLDWVHKHVSSRKDTKIQQHLMM